MTFIHTEPPEDKRVSVALSDIDHHMKYFGAGGRGKSRLFPSTEPKPAGPYVPTPIDVVRSQAEPVEYLDSFGKDSYWYDEIQAFKKAHGIPTDATD